MNIHRLIFRIVRKLSKNKFSQKYLFYFLQHPFASKPYCYFYSKVIKKHLKEFKLSNLGIYLESINVCNSSCVMCPYPKMTRPKKIMTKELFKKIVDDAQGLGISSLLFGFFGEPFLDPFIFERIKYLKERNFRITIFSNASILNEEKIKRLLENPPDRLNLALDSLKKETYEKIRRGLSFEKVVSNIKRLIEERKKLNQEYPKIHLVFVEQELNKGEKQEFIDYWKDKVDSIKVNLEQGTIDDFKIENQAYGKDRLISYPCKKLWSHVTVMSDGRVALCQCMDFDGKHVLGDLNKSTIREIWEGKIFKRVRELHLNYQGDQIELCKNCVYPYRLNFRTWWQAFKKNEKKKK